MINILDEAYTLIDEEGVEFEKNEAALKKYFNIFNEDYFDGKLDPIPLTWFKAQTKHGYFLPSFKIKEQKCYPVKIGLNLNACGTFAAFRNVFVHEMLHYYVDVYIGLPKENWEMAEYYANRGDRHRVRTNLHNTPETCHAYEWARLAKELNEKYPELGNIETYAVANAETGVALYDKKFVVDWCKKNVILRHTKNGEKYVYCISVNSKDWENIQKYIQTGKGPSNYSGHWERLWPTLDNKDFRHISTSRSINRYYFASGFENDGKYAKMIRKVVDLGYISGDAVANLYATDALIQEDIKKFDYYLLNKEKVIKIAKGSSAERELKDCIRTGHGTLFFQGTIQLCDKRFKPSTWKKLSAVRELGSSWYSIWKEPIASMFEDCEWGYEYTIGRPEIKVSYGTLKPAK